VPISLVSYQFSFCFLRGLKTYLSKWKGKGFDQDLKKLTGILEAGDMAHAQLLVRLIIKI
jgi:hypothetical protein